MRILIDARYLDGTYSGIATYSRELIEHLALIDGKNEYFILVHPSFRGPLEVGENFKLLTYGAKPVSLSTLYSLGRSVDALNVDLMHSLFPVAPRHMRTPLLVTVHDLQPFVDPEFSAKRPRFIQWAYNLFYRHAYPSTLQKAKWIINDSYHTRDTVAEYFPLSTPKLIVARPGLGRSTSSPPYEEFQAVRDRHGLENPYVLYYGSTRPNKNIPNMIRAFRRYLDQHEDAATEFILILKKDRFYRDISRAIRHEGLKGRVKVFNQVSYADQRALLRNARAFLFATKYEGFGFPVLEAMAAGVPVLAADSGALPEICDEAALFVSPDESEEIARGIGQLLTEIPLRERLIERGRRHVEQFDWKESAERIHGIYQLLF